MSKINLFAEAFLNNPKIPYYIYATLLRFMNWGSQEEHCKYFRFLGTEKEVEESKCLFFISQKVDLKI